MGTQLFQAVGEFGEGFVGGEFVADDAGVELVDEGAPLGTVDGDVVGGLHYFNHHLGGFVAVAGEEALELVGFQALGGDVADHPPAVYQNDGRSYRTQPQNGGLERDSRGEHLRVG